VKRLLSGSLGGRIRTKGIPGIGRDAPATINQPLLIIKKKRRISDLKRPQPEVREKKHKLKETGIEGEARRDMRGMPAVRLKKKKKKREGVSPREPANVTHGKLRVLGL